VLQGTSLNDRSHPAETFISDIGSSAEDQDLRGEDTINRRQQLSDTGAAFRAKDDGEFQTSSLPIAKFGRAARRPAKDARPFERKEIADLFRQRVYRLNGRR